jgi:hypothetical protein
MGERAADQPILDTGALSDSMLIDGWILSGLQPKRVNASSFSENRSH